MGCAGCSTGKDGTPGGCQNNGTCLTGGCNRLNTFDWLSMNEIYDPSAYHIVEVSFKNGARKEFFLKDNRLDVVTGDIVVVDAGGGYDIGRLNMSGELVRLQMKKKRVSEDNVLTHIIRKAHTRDLEKLDYARIADKRSLVRARAIARTLELNMKIGDIEHRGDGRKATFYYTADGRIDFRELVRDYAKEFKIKVEMRQIGARQESARIGGLGSCGRELCCSTWLTDFKSVTTSAARYQNISINQSKLSGQCGRLKCCLNYELDTYMDALKEFPKNVDRLEAESGKAHLIKTDIFKRLLYYAISSERGRGPIVAIGLDRVKEIKAMNVKGEKPHEFVIHVEVIEPDEDKRDLGFADVDEIELPNEKKRKSNKRRNQRRGNRNSNKGQAKKNSDDQGNANATKKSDGPQQKSNQQKNAGASKRPNRSNARKKPSDQRDSSKSKQPSKNEGEGNKKHSEQLKQDSQGPSQSKSGQSKPKRNQNQKSRNSENSEPPKKEDQSKSEKTDRQPNLKNKDPKISKDPNKNKE